MDRVVGLGVAALAWTAHVLFLLFLLFGGFVAWWEPWVVVPHLAVAVWGVVIVTTRRPCPLTAVEDWGRVRAGHPPLPAEGFIPHYLEGRAYPLAWARGVEVAAGLLVVASWAVLAILLLR